MAEAKDGLVSACFRLEFTGKLVGAFREVTGLGSENAVVEYKRAGPRANTSSRRFRAR